MRTQEMQPLRHCHAQMMGAAALNNNTNSRQIKGAQMETPIQMQEMRPLRRSRCHAQTMGWGGAINADRNSRHIEGAQLEHWCGHENISHLGHGHDRSPLGHYCAQTRECSVNTDTKVQWVNGGLHEQTTGCCYEC